MFGSATRVVILAALIAFALAEGWKRAYVASKPDASILYVFAFVGFIVAAIVEYGYQTVRKVYSKSASPQKAAAAEPEESK